MSAIKAKLDALMSRLSNQERRSHSTNEVGTEEGVGQKCVVEEGLAHERPYQVEEAHFVSGNRSYNFKPYNNLPTYYNLALRNHENFSYGGGMQQGQILVQNFQ